MVTYTTANLLTKHIASDKLGKTTTSYTHSEVFVTVSSIGMTETFEARQKGLKPQLKLTMCSFDYNGEQLIEIDNIIYSIYRTYMVDTDNIELYLSERIGNGSKH